MDYISWRAHLRGWSKWHVLLKGAVLLCGNPIPSTGRIATRDVPPPAEELCGSCRELAERLVARTPQQEKSL